MSKSIPSDHEMVVYHTMAEQAICSKMYANNFKDKSAVMMIMLSARELGIPPMQALNGGINIIQGKVEISARMMNALIRRAGHKITLKECSDLRCEIVGTRCDTGETLASSFSIEEASRAGLIKAGGGWNKWPKDMCFARALSRLARQLFSDVIGIGYVEGEIMPTNEIISFPAVEVVVEEMKEISELDLMVTYLDLFAEEDKALAEEYLNSAKNHFKWTTVETIKELMKDTKKTKERFLLWKNKRKSNEK